MKGPLGSKRLPYDKIPKDLQCVLFSNYIPGDSDSYFLGMFMLIRLLDTLSQTRVWVGRLHTLVRVPCGVKCPIYGKYCNLYGRFLFKLLFLETSYFLGMIMLISKKVP